MGRNSTAVALVPARSGSKGIPNKNLQVVGGLTLVGRAVQVGHAVDGIERVVVSTDSHAIADEAERHGADIHWRPADLASDGASIVDTVRHVFGVGSDRRAKPRYAVLLEPTSPLRIPADVTACLDAVLAGADSAATFTEASLHPHRAFRIEGEGVAPFIAGSVAWRRRQDLVPPAFQLTGGAYAFDLDAMPPDAQGVLFGTIAPIIVPRTRSIDIDDSLDLRIANALCNP